MEMDTLSSFSSTTLCTFSFARTTHCDYKKHTLNTEITTSVLQWNEYACSELIDKDNKRQLNLVLVE